MIRIATDEIDDIRANGDGVLEETIEDVDEFEWKCSYRFVFEYKGKTLIAWYKVEYDDGFEWANELGGSVGCYEAKKVLKTTYEPIR